MDQSIIKINKMKFFVKVKPKAKREKIEKINDNHFVIKVKEPAERGKANQAVIKIFAEYFKVSPSQVVISSGLKSKNKILEIYKK